RVGLPGAAPASQSVGGRGPTIRPPVPQLLTPAHPLPPPPASSPSRPPSHAPNTPPRPSPAAPALPPPWRHGPRTVPRLPVRTHVRRVVQFHQQQRPCRVWGPQHEIHVLRVDLVLRLRSKPRGQGPAASVLPPL